MISPMRMPGLATGMDTETMVKQMMTPYKAKVDSVKQSRDLIKIKQDLYRDVLKEFRGIYSKYLDVGSSANSSTNLILSKNYQTVNFSSSNESVVTATGMVGCNGGNYKIEVNQVATAENLKLSIDDLKYTSPKDSTIKKNLSLNFPVIKKDKDGNLIKTDPIKLDVDLTGKTSGGDIASAINNSIAIYNKDSNHADKIDVGVNFSELGNCINIQGRKPGAENNINFSAIVTTQDKLVDIVPQKTFNTTAGKDALVSITDSFGNTNLQPSKYADGTIKKDMSGMPIKEDFHAYSSNFINIDGVQFNINGASNGETITLTGKPDTKNLVDNVKKFVADYNEMVDKVSKKLTEKLNRNYKPLSEDQKKEMKDDEVKLWNDKVKEGQLRNDSLISSIMNKCLNIFSTSENSSIGSLKDIGISLNPDYRTQKGKLVLDETKLSQALTENGDKVINLLTDSNTGAFNKLKDVLREACKDSTSPLLKKAGYEDINITSNDLTKKMTEKDKLIYDLERDLAKREQGFYSRFAALEKAMNQMNSQQSWLAQSLGGGK